MSVSAYCLAVRNYLRDNLTDFYSTTQEKHRNCKVMLDEKTTADCGQEFISIYGDSLTVAHCEVAVEESVSLTVAVSRKIAVVPPDYRGELGYINNHALPGFNPTEETAFEASWKSVEARCREIARLVGATARYEIMYNTNQALDAEAEGVEYLEPLKWERTDGRPQQVGAEHFISYFNELPDADPIFGLLMKVYFSGAKRLQPAYDWDRNGS